MNQVNFFRCLGLLTAAVVISVPAASGQGQGQGQGGQQGGSAGTTTRPTQPSPTTSGRETRQTTIPTPQTFPEMQRPMFLSGKVILDDGSPAPPSVVIERVCSGMPIPEAYTDSKGRFSFQVGRNVNFIPDASVSGYGSGPGFSGRSTGGFGSFGTSTSASGGISERELAGCELRASLAGYRSDVIQLTGRRFMDNPDVGTIVLRRIAGVEGFTISATSLQAPKNARKAFSNGVKEAGKQKWEKAAKELEKAVGVYPAYAEAWDKLGQVYEQELKFTEAREAYAKAMEADSKFVSPYLRTAILDTRQQDWRAVADLTGSVLKMNPFDFPGAYYYNSLAHLNLRNLTAAENSAREAIKQNLQSRFPEVEQILGLALAQQNNYSEAAVHLKRYLELAPEASNADLVRKQVSQLEQYVSSSQTVPAQQ